MLAFRPELSLPTSTSSPQPGSNTEETEDPHNFDGNHSITGCCMKWTQTSLSRVINWAAKKNGNVRTIAIVPPLLGQMSHIFPLEQLAQHKLCMNFSTPGKPPSIEWAPLTRPISLASVAACLSLRVDVSVANGRNSMALFIIEDPEAVVAQDTSQCDDGSSSSSRTKPGQSKIQNFQASSSTLISSIMPSLTMTPECGGQLLAPKQSIKAAHSRLAESHLERDDGGTSRRLNAHASPLIRPNTPLALSATDSTPQMPLNVSWIPNPGYEWQHLPDTFQWEGYPDGSRMHVDRGHTEHGMLDQMAHYTDDSPEATYGNGEQSSVHPDNTWTRSEGTDPATSSSNSSLYQAVSSYPGASSDLNSSNSTESAAAVLTPGTDSSSSVVGDHDYFSTVQPHHEPSPAPSSVASGSTEDGGHSIPPRIHCRYEGCNRTFRNEYTYSVHAAVHTKKQKKRFQCPTCHETFSRRHDMMRHEVSQHGKVPDWTCDRCRRFFSSELMFKNHRCPSIRKAIKPAFGQEMAGLC